LPDSLEEQEKTAKLEALSKETGISVETLKVIKAVESSVRESRKAQTQMLEDQKSKQKYQQLSQLAQIIRQITLFKNTTTFTISDLINQVSDSTRGQFTSTRKSN
jgi:NADH dehydrogenase/NADH:ubiquinone oxidoreductase subunit G